MVMSAELRLAPTSLSDISIASRDVGCRVRNGQADALAPFPLLNRSLQP